MTGTILHIGNERMNKNLKISVLSTGELELEVPEVGEVSRAYIYGQATNDGEWHKVNE